jgi:hypothetical protein
LNEEGRGFVVAPLALFEVEFEIGFDAVELGQASFSKAPEGFDPVDVSAAIGEGFLFVNAHMFVVVDIDQAIITWPAIGEKALCGSIQPRMMARRVSWEQSVMISV